MSNFRIGEKVVCINNECGWLDGEKKLIKGEIYTVLYVTATDLVVLHNDAGWDKSRFRKLDYAHTEKICAEIIENLKLEELKLN